jgi:hypothetical protein
VQQEPVVQLFKGIPYLQDAATTIFAARSCFPHLQLAANKQCTATPPSIKHTCRSEARAVLEAALQRPGGCGSRSAHTLYLKALINAEGGHYDQAVADAQAALGEAGQEPGPCWAATLALLALLLSARWEEHSRR